MIVKTAGVTSNKTLLNAMKKDKNLTNEKAEEIWYSSANDGYCGGIDHQHYNSTRYHGVNLHAFSQKVQSSSDFSTARFMPEKSRHTFSSV